RGAHRLGRGGHDDALAALLAADLLARELVGDLVGLAAVAGELDLALGHSRTLFEEGDPKPASDALASNSNEISSAVGWKSSGNDGGPTVGAPDPTSTALFRAGSPVCAFASLYPSNAPLGKNCVTQTRNPEQPKQTWLLRALWRRTNGHL